MRIQASVRLIGVGCLAAALVVGLQVAARGGAGEPKEISPASRLQCGGGLKSFGEASYTPGYVSDDTPEMIASRMFASEHTAPSVAAAGPSGKEMGRMVYNNTNPAKATRVEAVYSDSAARPILIVAMERARDTGWRLDWVAKCES